MVVELGGVTLCNDQTPLLARASEAPRQAMILAIDTGLRRDELFSLTWPQIDQVRGRISTTKQTKTNRQRFAPLPRNGLDDDELIGDPPGATARGYTEWTAVQVARASAVIALTAYGNRLLAGGADVDDEKFRANMLAYACELEAWRTAAMSRITQIVNAATIERDQSAAVH